MNLWLKRLGLSFIVTLGFAVSTKLWAQAPLVPASQPFDSNPSAPLGSVLARPVEPQPLTAHPKLNKHGYCCDSDLNWFGCGGLKAQHDFVFGSCRTFFGEPCVGKMPHPYQLRRLTQPSVSD